MVFQPHRYTRTQALLEEFGGAFFLADHVIVTDIYAAGEDADPRRRRARSWPTRWCGTATRRWSTSRARQAIPRLLRQRIQPGDIVLTLGAGDVWKVGEALVRLAAGAKPRVREAGRAE